MSVDVRSRIVIARSRNDVASYAANPDNAPDWYVNIKSAVWLTPPPLHVGTRIAFNAEFLGRSLSYTYEVTDYVPDERMVMTTQQGPFPMTTTYVWETVGAGSTRMTLRNHGRPAGFSRFAAPLLGLAMRWANRKDLRRLKALLEGHRPVA